MPNVLFVTIDQWRADGLSCAGHPCARTPNVDALAARGVRFARHYAQAAPCGPSRASLLTGTYLHTHRSVDNGTPLSAHLTTLALELRAAGYDPTLFGYTDTTADPRTIDDPDSPWLRTYEGVLPGFTVGTRLPEAADEWVAWLRGHGYDFTDAWDAYRQRDEVPEEVDAGHGASWAPTRYAAEHSEAAFLVERFDEWHGALEADRPWCAHVTFLRPHPPYVAPSPYHDLIDPATVPAPVRHPTVEEEGAEHPLVAGAMFVDVVRPPTDPVDLAQLQATYWGNLAEVDAQLGRLLHVVDAAGQHDETVVVLTSDHGEQLGDHWMLQKLGYFEASYHVPLIIAGPGVADIAAGRVVDDHFTESVDVMPTILDLCGAQVPSQCAGSSLRPFLDGGEPARWREAAHWEWDFRDAAAFAPIQIELEDCILAVHREPGRKYVHFAGLPPAFYDLDDDPGELHNLAGDPARQGELLECAQRLLSWRLSSDDQTLANLTATPDGMVDLRSL